MAFKEPNLVHADNPNVAAAATRLLRRRNSGTTTRDSDCKVLWMGNKCALVKRNPFSYNGESYSGSVYVVDLERGGGIVSGGLESRVHICGHKPFCAGTFTGTYGRLTENIINELIVKAPGIHAETARSEALYQQTQEARWQREADEREARQQEAVAQARKQERDQTVASRLDILWNFAIHWPAKYRHAIEACLDTESEFDRASLQRSVE